MIPILPEYRTIAVIMNPRARRGAAYASVRRRLETVLRDLEIQATWYETRGIGHAMELAQRLREAPIDMLLVAGGDGTVNEVINGWVNHPVPLGVLPLGTSNILARVYGLRGSLEAACIQIFYGKPRPIPVGRANDRYFVLMTGVGFDAEVLTQTPPEQKFRWNRLAYAWHAIRLGLRGCQYELDVRVPEGESTVSGVKLVVVTLVPNYGGFFRIVPRRWLAEHPMWMVGFQRNSAFHYAKYALTALGGWHVRLPDVLTMPVENALEIQARPHPVPVQVDGECAGTTPVVVRQTGDRVYLVTPSF